MVKVVNVNPYISFDKASESAIDQALAGNVDEFRSKVSLRLRVMDARRMMNDVRLAKGKPEIQLEIKTPFNRIRELYIAGHIFNVGDKVTVEGQQMEVVKRGTNHLVLLNSTGQAISKFLSDIEV